MTQNKELGSGGIANEKEYWQNAVSHFDRYWIDGEK